jgi:REP-associated tyrosine transposase
MSTPKHRIAPGTSYFVTTKCWQSCTVFQVRQNAEILIEVLFHYRDRNSYLLHEFVVMPDHLHLMLTPSPTTSLEKAVQFIKGGSSYQIRKARNQKMEIWQVGFHDWTIRDSNDWRVKVEYIQNNPVRAKLVQKPEDWPYSSASGRFNLDPIPDKFLQLSSGAKAQTASAQTLGLKPQPPKENSHINNTPSQAKAARL